MDAAFGAFAVCSPQHQHLVAGLDLADSITIDARKWLNVPYDSAVQFPRHLSLQSEIFQNAASYLPQEVSASNFVHLTQENSRRLRALAAWFTMHAYGRETYARLVQHHCELAQTLSGWIDGSELFQRLAETRRNVVNGWQKARISGAANLTFPGSVHGRAMGLLLRFSLSCCPRQCGVWGSAPGC